MACDGSGDGIADLILKFDTREIAWAIGDAADGEEFVLTITGKLKDGTSFRGEDTVVILNKTRRLKAF